MKPYSVDYTEFRYNCGTNLSVNRRGRREKLTLHDGRVIEGPRLRALKHRNAKFKLDLEDWAELYVNQDGKCAICKKVETHVLHGSVCELSIDHCHKTGEVRGLLCRKCNGALGLFSDDPERLWDALAYIMKYGSNA